jgi:hypothetical protein
MKMAKTEKNRSRLILFSGIAWALSYMVCLLVVRKLHPPQAIGLSLSVIPAIGFGWFLYEYFKGIHQMDELERRIQLEATAVAFCLSLLLMMVLGLVQMVVELNPDDWSYRHLVPFFFASYFLGLFRARRKYA